MQEGRDVTMRRARYVDSILYKRYYTQTLNYTVTYRHPPYLRRGWIRDRRHLSRRRESINFPTNAMLTPVIYFNQEKYVFTLRKGIQTI